jgi:hypothetical protein
MGFRFFFFILGNLINSCSLVYVFTDSQKQVEFYDLYLEYMVRLQFL